MRTHAAILLTVILWAAAFPAIRAGLAAYTFGHLVLLRFLVASLVLFVIWILRGSPRPERQDMPRIALLGILGFAIYPIALSFGELTVPAGTASVIVNLSPIFTATCAAIFLGERLSRIAWAGILIAFTGAAVAAAGSGATMVFSLGVLLTLVAALVQGLQFVVSKSLLSRYDPISLTIYSVWCGTAVDLIFARGSYVALLDAPFAATMAVLFLGIFSTVIATITWSYALARVPAGYAAPFLYLVTPISIVIAAVWLDETPTTATIAGAVIATAGVALVKGGDTVTARLSSLRVPAVAVIALFLAADAGGASSLHVQRVDRPLTIDDFTAMQPAGDIAPRLARAAGFLQRNPVDGEAVSERTEAYLAYDAAQLYVAFICFDTQPEAIRSYVSRREDILTHDFVTVQLDTFRDQRRAYVHGANAHGVQSDAMWVEGRGFDHTFDTVFHSDARITPEGYIVLLRIPFASLRFPPSDAQSWGLLLTRDIPRRGEESFWPRYTKKVDGRLNQMGTLEGLTGISPPETMQMIPYSVGRAARTLSNQATRGDGGLDAKFIIRDSFVVDATLNPDFSQVESDEPQNTTNERFELLFPEKRPFFLENASNFATPMMLVFTRRIADPRAGVRFTGKTGPWSLGALIADDEASAQRAHNGIVRISRDLWKQSSVGLLVTSRHGGDVSNDVAAIDGRFRLNEHWVTATQLALSRTGGEPGHAIDLSLHGSGSRTIYDFLLTQRSRDFHTALGFVPRTDLRHLEQTIDHFIYREGAINSIELINIDDISWDDGGDLLDWTVANGVQWNFRRPASFRVYYESGVDRIRPADYPLVTSTEQRRRWAAGFIVTNSVLRWLTLRMSGRVGSEVNFFPAPGTTPQVDRLQRVIVTATVRPSLRLTVDNNVIAVRFKAREGGVRTVQSTVARTKWNYQFNPRLGVRAIAQYDRVNANPLRTAVASRRNFNADFLISWILHPGTALFVGYNGNYQPDPRIDDEREAPEAGAAPLVNDRAAFFVKVSYLFRL